ncbi:MAG: hypothetical protein GY794_26435 [bacterium]|nr:hypothetical protein [bacterium]
MNKHVTKTDTQIGFRCQGVGCGEWIDDVRYVGPAGHAPQNLCFECWMAHWEVVEARVINGGRWSYLDEALWLICRGLSVVQAADVINTHAKTLRRWIVKMRQRPELVPDWLIHMQDTREARRKQQE